MTTDAGRAPFILGGNAHGLTGVTRVVATSRAHSTVGGAAITQLTKMT